MGNVEANNYATKTIEELHPKSVFMFGLAGSLKPDVDIGTIIVSEEIHYYESTKEADNGTNYRPKIIQSDSYLLREIRNFWNLSKIDLYFKDKMNVIFGPLAVGEKVVASDKYKKRILAQNQKLVGIDMESYGVCYATITDLYRPRFIAIRAVCDKADKNKSDSFRSLALEKGTNFLYSFIKHGKPLLKEERALASSKILAIHHTSQNPRTLTENDVKRCYPKINNPEVSIFSIDQSSSFINGIMPNPETALAVQKDKILALTNSLLTTQYSRLGYFSFAHIPLIFHLANQLYTINIDVFSAIRPKRDWIELPSTNSNFQKLEVVGIGEEINTRITQVLLFISISQKIQETQVRESVNLLNVPVVEVSVNNPELDNVTSQKQLLAYSKSFTEVVQSIKKVFPNVEIIHMFFAGPPTLAFLCGQQISPTIDPNIIVYNFSKRDKPVYGWGVNLATEEVVDFRKKKESLL